MINYKHAIQMYKLFNQCQPDSEFMHMNFQFNQNPRIKHANFFMRQNYHIGQNILLNRLSHLNDKIERSWLDQSLNTFKIKCKQLFLQTNWQHQINNIYNTGYQKSPLRSLPDYVQSETISTNLDNKS